MVAAIITSMSLVFPGPIVSVASDGPWVAVAEGRSARDCDRVSIWVTTQNRVIRLGRKTACGAGAGIAGVAIARHRALWLHHAAGTWTLWTATTTARSPHRLATATDEVGGLPPIVIGGGDYDRRQGYGDGDVLPYAVGRTVVVLTAAGSRSYTWEAPSRVTALDSDPGILAVAVEDGRVFVLEDGKVVQTYEGATPATSVGLMVEGIATQRGRRLEYVSREGTRGTTLRPGERAVFGSGWGAVVVWRSQVRVAGIRDPLAVRLAVKGTTASIDNDRLTYALGRRVTTRFLGSP